MQKQGIKLKFGKAKSVQKSEMSAPQERVAVLKTFEVTAAQLSVSEVKFAWKQVDTFLQQQFTAAQVAKRLQKQLEDKVYALESQVEQLKADRQTEEDLEQKVDKLEKEHVEAMQKLQEIKAVYEEKISQKNKTKTMVEGWLQNIREVYSNELDTLASKNAEMMTNNEILMQQISALRKIKDKLKELQGEEDKLNLDNVVITSDSIEDIKADLIHTGNLIWSGIKHKIDNVLRIP